MDIRSIRFDEINPAPYNPRIDLQPGDAEYEKLRRSIDEFGLVELLVWNARTGNLVGGHQRMKILQANGETSAPCVVVDLDDQREKMLNIALNKISGDWDYAKLRDLFEELDTGEFDLSITGFDEADLAQLMTDIGPIDVEDVRDDSFDIQSALDDISEPVTKPGDVWLLGSHRVLCGDSTRAGDVQRLMAGKKAEMIFTDPPYNVAYESADGKTIANDGMDSDRFYEFLLDAFRNAFDVSQPGAAIYIAHSENEGINFRRAMHDSGWMMKQCLVWVKNAFVIGRQDYQWKHEPILYGWKPGASHRWFGGRKQSTVIEIPYWLSVNREEAFSTLTFTNGMETVTLKVADFEIIGSDQEECSTIWRFEKPLKSAEHPTMKPIPLVARAVVNSSRPNDLVLDMFLGSGTTLMAAEQTGRVCYGMEFDPKYCDVIVRRWEEFTGKQAVRQ